MNWRERLKRWTVPVVDHPSRGARAPAGMHHFQRERDGEYVRFHLRVEPDGRSLLIACAAEAVLLSPAGTSAVWTILSGKPAAQLPDETTAAITRLLDEIGTPDSRYPILQIEDPDIGGRRFGLTPIQADLLFDGESSPFALLDRLWTAQIPHARIRPTAVDAHVGAKLVDAVVHAEDVGMIAGLLAPAHALLQSDVLEQLAAAGLDYVAVPCAVSQSMHQTIFAEDQRDVREVMRRVRSLEMTPVLQVPLFGSTAESLDDVLPTWLEQGVGYLEVYALASPPATNQHSGAADQQTSLKAQPTHEQQSTHGEPNDQPLQYQELRQLAAWIEELSGQHESTIAWLPPLLVPSGGSPSELAKAGPRAGGPLSIRIERDGSVVPSAGPYVATGNLLRQPWSDIWRHPAYQAIRQRRREATFCDQCPRLEVCVMGCPADTTFWAAPQPGAANLAGGA